MKEWDNKYFEFIGFILISLILLFFLYPNSLNKEIFKINEPQFDEYLKKEKFSKNNFDYIIKKSSLLNNKETILENKLLRIKIANKGAIIKEVLIKNFKNNNSNINKDLFIIKKNNFSFGFLLKDLKSKIYNTKYFTFTSKFKEGINNISLIMRTYISEKDYIEYIYILDKYGYNLSFIIRSNGLFKYIKHNSIILYWKQKVLSLEKDKTWEGNSTQLYFSYGKEKNVKYLSESNYDKKELKNVNWIAAKQQFFTSILSLKNSFSKVIMKSYVIDSDNFLKNFEIYSPIKNNEIKISSKWYFGPLNYDLLKSYNNNYEKIIPFGWGILRWLNTFFFLKIFQILSKTNLNSGLIIILMTVVVKLILCPIMYKQYKLGAMMKIIRPELENINDKYQKLDSLKKQQMIIDLYRKTGINPMSGCLPAILQIPIFYSLFKFFPTIIELRGKYFLWADDLTSYDSIFKLPFSIPIYGNHVSLFTLLYSIVLLLYTKISNNNTSQQGIPDMRPIMYLMPLMMLLFINNYASGLSLYYFISNLINIILIFFIKNYLINEDMIREYIEENKNKITNKNIWNEKIQKFINNYKK